MKFVDSLGVAVGVGWLFFSVVQAIQGAGHAYVNADIFLGIAALSVALWKPS